EGIEVTGASDPANGSTAAGPGGTITYTPDAGFISVDTFTYEITDDDGDTDTAMVVVLVVPAGGDEPIAVDDAATTEEETPVDIDVLANDAGEGIEVTDVTDPANGAVVDNGDGTVTYTPEDGFTGVDTFTYEITDDDGDTDTAMVAVLVVPAQGAPIAVDDAATTEESTPVDVDLLANDSGEGIEVSDVSDPTNGSVVDNGDGTVTYTPDDGFTGTDTFPYEITDDDGETDTAMVTITVTPAGADGPTAVDDTATTPQDTPVEITVLANDSGDGIEVSDVTDPTNGAATQNPSGTITYTPDDGFTGSDTFTYEITDDDGDTDTATVTVTVTPDGAGEGPTAVDDTATTSQDTPVNIDVLANDSGEGIEATGATVPANGSVAAGPGGTITYTPDAGFTGIDTFTYEITDDDGDTDAATVTVTVTADGGPGEGPNAVDDVVTTEENTPVTIDVMANDTGDGIELTGTSEPASGSLVVNTDGTLTYTPDGDFTGTDVFAYQITDTGGQTDSANVTTTVVPAPAKIPPVTSGPGAKPPVTGPQVTGPQVTNLPDTGSGMFADYGTTLRALLFALAVCGMTMGLVMWRRETAAWNTRS
ncbi:MAG: Ig-like domain-containing protein, partial [Thermomicrobiales bacterium]